jgi:lysophospholipid hydrolase
MHVNAGQVIYRQNDPSDCFYIVIQGRLRSIVEQEGGGVDIRAEYGQGESVGELDSITDTKRPTTLHAIRDSELARMPMTLFNAIAVRHPGTTIHMTRLIASRVRDSMAAKAGHTPAPLTDTVGANNFNLKVHLAPPAVLAKRVD